MKTSLQTLAVITALSLCLATTAQAQTTPQTGPQTDQSQSEATRAALNTQQAVAAQQQLDQDAANARAHDVAEAQRSHTIQNNDAAYDTAMHEHHRTVREYNEAVRVWHEDVAACQAGDKSRCDRSEPVQ